MKAIEMLVLLLVLAVITICDMKYYKIPNGCILIGMIAGLCLHPERIVMSVIQMVAIFIIFYPFYLIKGIGAGDVKLFMMLGCFFNKQKLFNIAFISFGIGAVMASIKIVCNRQAKEQLYKGLGFFKKLIITKSVDLYECNKTNKKTVVRMSLPISAATIIGGFIL